MNNVFYEKVEVTFVPIEDPAVENRTAISFMPSYSIFEMLEFMGDMPLSDQVFMICNLLTISGFTQREIATILKVAPKTYRNRLLKIRSEFRDKELREL